MSTIETNVHLDEKASIAVTPIDGPCVMTLVADEARFRFFFANYGQMIRLRDLLNKAIPKVPT